MSGAESLFICEGCGGVFPDTCPDCPDQGCTVGQIMDAIRTAKKSGDVTAARNHYGRHIATLKKSKTEYAKVSAIHIENMVLYRHKCIGEGWA